MTNNSDSWLFLTIGVNGINWDSWANAVEYNRGFKMEFTPIYQSFYKIKNTPKLRIQMTKLHFIFCFIQEKTLLIQEILLMF